MPRVPSSFVTSVTLVVASGSCTVSAECGGRSLPGGPCDLEGGITAEVCPRRVTGSRCRDSYDCPSGTECAALKTDEHPCAHVCCDPFSVPSRSTGENASSSTGASTTSNGGAAGGDEAPPEIVPSNPKGERTCNVPATESFEPLALVTGFAVKEFSLAPMSSMDGDTLAFEFDAGENARMVACSLFTCAPVIRSPNTLDGDGEPEIVNNHQCLLNHQVFTGSRGLVVPSAKKTASDTTITVIPACIDGGGLDESVALRSPNAAALRHCLFPKSWSDFARECSVVTRLTIGCWAYDESQLIGATRLREVSVTQTGNLDDRFAKDYLTCAKGERGRACLLRQHDEATNGQGDGGTGGAGGDGGSGADGSGGAGGASTLREQDNDKDERLGVCWDASESIECFPTCVTDADCPTGRVCASPDGDEEPVPLLRLCMQRQAEPPT